MKKFLLLILAVCVSISVVLNAGCTKKSGSSREAIDNSQTFKTVDEKASYLIKQAEAFYSSKEFQQAIETAQYVLNNLDKESPAAKNLIQKAKNQLQAAAQKAVGDVGNKLLGK